MEGRLRDREAELASTQAQFAQLLSDFKFNLKARVVGLRSAHAFVACRPSHVWLRRRADM